VGEGLEQVGESVTSGDDLLLCKLDTLGDVLFWECFSFLDVDVCEGGGDLESLLLPLEWVEVLDVIEGADWMVFQELFNLGLLKSPGVSGERKLWVGVELIDNLVPDRVEVLDFDVSYEWEVIATSVSVWIFLVKSGLSVEWLVGVSDIMEQKSHGLGPGVFHGVS